MATNFLTLDNLSNLSGAICLANSGNSNTIKITDRMLYQCPQKEKKKKRLEVIFAVKRKKKKKKTGLLAFNQQTDNYIKRGRKWQKKKKKVKECRLRRRSNSNK